MDIPHHNKLLLINILHTDLCLQEFQQLSLNLQFLPLLQWRFLDKSQPKDGVILNQLLQVNSNINNKLLL